MGSLNTNKPSPSLVECSVWHSLYLQPQCGLHKKAGAGGIWSQEKNKNVLEKEERLKVFLLLECLDKTPLQLATHPYSEIFLNNNIVKKCFLFMCTPRRAAKLQNKDCSHSVGADY